ncbi:RagB/SusD family nutrient uptake outer membrane protein [Dinghuibacter silviterrae]|uniref:Putative outer membrane starch-binding protein n=1 Tax=Dinghuibacter silviterrae TaxID=1539049 RepID=A0A4V3GLD2_9BACT|nr:RagB/SusD family nutrient uptake outer membrane protein [Dinghuibacter silviterrae]TDW99112.1 putative outer membrane starch-binding protein [Dinghuibacter silviterrae]
MKNIFIIGFVLGGIVLQGCSKILNEEPRSTYTPQYFQTTNGVIGGITSLYANLRYMYGNGYYLDACQTGTDEATYGQNADQNFKDLDLSGVGQVTGTTSRSDVLWNNVFPNINTASGIIENGQTAGVSASLIAEARFFRAFDYFLLVQTFGGVPLDLGSGILKFNTSAIRTSVRNTVPDVYTKAVFPDLDSAVAELPVAGRVTGGVTQTLARLYLAKAYLTYGWWLENPNNIPTYPLCDRTDPDGHNAQWYYQQAYNVASAAISDPGPFGLQPTFYNVNVATNDRNNEILLYADHTQSSQQYNGGSLTYSSGSSPDNFAGWMDQWNYTNIRSATSPSWSSVVSSVQRAATQDLGRPWTEMVPPIAIFENTFADKTNDSRYDGTFTTVYRTNFIEAGIKVNGAVPVSLYNANGLPVAEGAPILTFLNDDSQASAIDYSNSVYKSNVGAGVLPGRADFVVSPAGYSRIMYPGNWKLGPYRTDNNGGLGQPNAGSTRPWNIAKFSELFFIAAEAAVKGATPTAIGGTYANDGTARGLINVIRARAGHWSWSHAAGAALVQDNSAAMIAATPATVDINYLLAERTREYFGEGYRWYDLVRTQTWAQLSSSYTICGSTFGDHTQVTVTRTIPTSYFIRPIPQGQLDGMQMSDSAKAAYQNPGYQ